VVDPLALDIPYIVIGPDQYLPDVSQGNVTLISQHHLQTLPQEIKDLTAAQKDRFIRLPNLVIDFQQRQVLRNQKRYGLTPKEFKLLSLLVDNCEQVLSRKKIMQLVWETDYMGDTRTLDVHIRWLREKIEENPSRPKHLVTVRKVGYRFVMEPK
jgi:DNA-binding response OmpR family regulator